MREEAVVDAAESDPHLHPRHACVVHPAVPQLGILLVDRIEEAQQHIGRSVAFQ